MTIELKPCPNPWCSKDEDPVLDHYTNPFTSTQYWYYCPACDQMAPDGSTPEAAALIWNTRPKSEEVEQTTPKPVAKVHYPKTGGNVTIELKPCPAGHLGVKMYRECTTDVTYRPVCGDHNCLWGIDAKFSSEEAAAEAWNTRAVSEEAEKLREERSMRIAAGEAFDRAQMTNRALAEENDRLRARIAELATAAELATHKERERCAQIAWDCHEGEFSPLMAARLIERPKK